MKSRAPVASIQIMVMCAVLSMTAGTPFAGSADLYFPSAGGEWATVSLQETGWNAAKLGAAMAYAAEQNSSGVVILVGGRILAERYWTPHSAENSMSAYGYMRVGQTADNRAIEDVASVQKSVISFLAAMAREQGMLDLDKPVAGYLGDGWSKASPEQEARITVRHLMSMTSGLGEALNYSHPAGSVWAYNTKTYGLMVPVLEGVTDMDMNRLTFTWLTAPVGMTESRWEPRRWVQSHSAANPIGFATSARDLARFGLLVLAEGRWNGAAVLKDPRYLVDSLQPSQKLNASYGLLWWLLRSDHAVAALGRLSRFVIIVPDRQMVMVRLGDEPKDNDREFRRKFLKRVFAAMPE